MGKTTKWATSLFTLVQRNICVNSEYGLIGMMVVWNGIFNVAEFISNVYFYLLPVISAYIVPRQYFRFVHGNKINHDNVDFCY